MHQTASARRFCRIPSLVAFAGRATTWPSAKPLLLLPMCGTAVHRVGAGDAPWRTRTSTSTHQQRSMMEQARLTPLTTPCSVRRLRAQVDGASANGRQPFRRPSRPTWDVWAPIAHTHKVYNTSPNGAAMGSEGCSWGEAAAACGSRCCLNWFWRRLRQFQPHRGAHANHSRTVALPHIVTMDRRY